MYRFKTVLGHQLLNRSCLSDEKVADDINAHFSQQVDFFFDDGFRQTEFGNTVNHYASGFVECFKDGNIVTCSAHIGCCDDSTRPGADDDHVRR